MTRGVVDICRPIHQITPRDAVLCGTALIPRPTRKRGLSCSWGQRLLYFAYLDEFGHIGPYVARDDPKYNDSPVFGLGGMILPYDQVRSFSTWFYQLKCRLLEWEIQQSGQHPSTWEKKGSALFTTKNVTTYQEVRRATNRLLLHIRSVGGHVFYVGLQKNRPVAEFNAQGLYLTVLGEAMKRLNQYAAAHDAEMIIVMDEHQDRDAILTRASQAMYGGPAPRRRIIEPPFQVESERYQTIQCADWLCGLLGRIGAYQARPDEWGEMIWSQTYFQDRVDTAAARSSIRLQTATAQVETVEELSEVVDAGVAPLNENDQVNVPQEHDPQLAKAPD